MKLAFCFKSVVSFMCFYVFSFLLFCFFKSVICVFMRCLCETSILAPFANEIQNLNVIILAKTIIKNKKSKNLGRKLSAWQVTILGK